MASQNPIVIKYSSPSSLAALAAMGNDGLPALRVYILTRQSPLLYGSCTSAYRRIRTHGKAISELRIEYMVLWRNISYGIVWTRTAFVKLHYMPRPVISLKRAAYSAFQLCLQHSPVLPPLVTIECIAKRVKIDQNISNFMLPVGATINMDGTALYLTVASLFVAQVYGLNLSLQAQIMVFLTAVLASVGTAGIPGASIGLMGIIFNAAGIPVEGIAIVIGVDRLLDMSRTVVNITGDSVGAVVISHSEGKLSAGDII